MTKCTESGCRSLEWKCADCGRVVMTGMLENMGEWISVKDQLPPEKENVLFFNGKQEVRYGFFQSDPPPVDSWATESSIWINDLSYDEIGTASHWMPLPKPPEKK